MEKHNYFIRLQEKTETAPEAYKSHNLIKLFEILFEHQDRKGLPIKLGQEILGKEVKSECFGEHSLASREPPGYCKDTRRSQTGPGQSSCPCFTA